MKKLSKTDKVAATCLGACFACAPLWILKLIPMSVIYPVFGVAITGLILSVTGVLGKLFNKK